MSTSSPLKNRSTEPPTPAPRVFQRTARRAARLVWIPLLTWAASALVAEVAFRAAGKQPAADLLGLYQPFGDQSYRLRPHVATSDNWACGRFEVYTDGLGLRCGQDGGGAIQEETRLDILLIGDSQAFCQGVNYDESIAGVLTARARQRGWIVANAGVGGHFLQNQIELVQVLHDRNHLHADVILLLLTPRMIVGAGEYIRVHVGEDGRLYTGAVTTATRLRTWLKTHSSLYVAIRDAYRNTSSSHHEHPQVLTYYRTDPITNRPAEQLTRLIARLRNWAAERGSTLVLAYAPMTVELDFEPVQTAAAAHNVPVSLDAPLHTAQRVSQTADVPLINLRPALAQLKANGQPLRLQYDAHYSPAGCRACAQAIWTALESRTLAQHSPHTPHP